MLSLLVAAPGDRKVEVEVPASATFGDVKQKVADELGAPPEKLRLLCKGKERKDGRETLASAGVTGKAKLMLMLSPGYVLPAPRAAPDLAKAGAEPAQASEEMKVDEARIAHGELPRKDGGTGEQVLGTVHIRQGRNRYHVSVPHGLHAATFGDLAEYVAASMLPERVPSTDLRFIHRGRTAQFGDALGAEGDKECSVMLLFHYSFHEAVEGARWLEEQTRDLEEAERGIEGLKRRIEANFTDPETTLKLAEIGAVVETMRQSIESVRIREAKLPAMETFRDRVCAADDAIRELRKRVNL